MIKIIKTEHAVYALTTLLMDSPDSATQARDFSSPGGLGPGLTVTVTVTVTGRPGWQGRRGARGAGRQKRAPRAGRGAL